MKAKELIEKVAKAIYKNSFCDPEEYKEVVGIPMRAWQTNPDELTEHERDDYRRMAVAAVAAVVGMPMESAWILTKENAEIEATTKITQECDAPLSVIDAIDEEIAEMDAMDDAEYSEHLAAMRKDD